MKQKLLFKTIILATMLCMGMSAWATITDTEIINCNFNNGETLFTGVERCTVSNGEDATLNSNVVKFTTASNATNKYGLAKYELGSNLSGASSVDISFDMFIDNSNPNYHKYFAIGDGSKRTYAKQSYDGSGCFFYVGLYRSSSVNYFSINGSKINNSNMFSTWLHVDATLNFVTRQVTYAIKDITKTTTHYSGTIAFADNNAEELTQIDYYGCINSNTAMMDNLVITKYVDDTVVDYSIKAVDGGDNELATLAKGKAYNNGSTIAKWSKYVKVNDIWYSTSSSTFTKAITETTDDKITYTATNAAYFYEMEKLTRSGGAYLTEESGSYSGGLRLRLSKNSMYYTPALSAGVYKLSIPWVNSNGSASEVYVYTRTGGELSEVLETFTATGSTSGTFTYTITVPEGSSIAFKGNEGGSANNNARMDYMTLSRVVPAEITSAGWATLYTAYPLDFSSLSSSLTAYTATCTSSTVTLTQVNNVPANTGVVLKLKGDPDTYNIPATASSSTDKGHLLGSATDATAYNAYNGYDLYMMVKNNDKAQFKKVTSGSIAAGKAFLKIASGASSLAPVMNVVFANDNTTGINNVNRETITNNRYFDLQGRKVANPTKGLYIVNGKKVIIK